jgi:hypothetical protein
MTRSSPGVAIRPRREHLAGRAERDVGAVAEGVPVRRGGRQRADAGEGSGGRSEGQPRDAVGEQAVGAMQCDGRRARAVHVQAGGLQAHVRVEAARIDLLHGGRHAGRDRGREQVDASPEPRIAAALRKGHRARAAVRQHHGARARAADGGEQRGLAPRACGRSTADLHAARAPVRGERIARRVGGQQRGRAALDHATTACPVALIASCG